MTTLDELRQAMENRAKQAPDGVGLVQAAQLGAARVRRRRRITRLTLAAGLVLAIAVGTPVGLHLRAAPRPVDAAVPDRPRTASEMTLTIDPSVHAVTGGYGISGSGQYQRFTITSSAGKEISADVYVYDHGNLDRVFGNRPFEVTTVQGQPARYRNDNFSAEVAWRATDDSVVSVTYHSFSTDPTAKAANAADRAALLKISEGIRIGPPRAIKTPIRFGKLRDGLRLTGVTVRYSSRVESVPSDVVITLAYPNSVENNRRQVDVTTLPEGLDPGRAGLRQVASVGGHPAWFGEGGRRDKLVLGNGACTVEFLTSPGMTERQVRDLAGESQLFPCDQTDTWVPPVG